MKLLKQFRSAPAAYTPLKRGVSEKADAVDIVRLINTRLQSGVITNARTRNRFNGFPNLI